MSIDRRTRRALAAAVVGIVGIGVQQQHASGAVAYWDTNGATTGASGDGITPTTVAPGTWDAATANWTADPNGESAPAAWAAGDVATFSAGTNATGSFAVTMSGVQTIGGMDFQEGTVDIVGTAGNGLTMTGPTTFNVAGGAIGQVTASLAGTGVRITKTGPGTLYFPNGKTYTGGVTLNEGTLQVFSETSLGTNPAGPTADYITFNGGTLTNRNGQGATAITISANRGIRVDAGGATFDCFPPPASTFGSWIYNGAGATGLVGSGTITKKGGNLLVFGGNNSGFTGKFVVLEGTLQSNSPNNAGEAGLGAQPPSFVADGITLDGGGLRVGPNNYTIHVNRGIVLGPNGGRLDTANSASMITVDSVISGVGSLTKTSVAATPQTNSVGILNADNTYTGNTIVSVGTLRLGNGGSIANGRINVATGTTFAGTPGGPIEEVIWNISNDTADLATIAGTGILDIGDLGVILSVTGTQTLSEYVLVDKPAGSPNVPGSTFATESLPAGWSIDYDGTPTNPNSIVAVVPEPGSLCAIGAGAMLLLARRRPRA